MWRILLPKYYYQSPKGVRLTAFQCIMDLIYFPCLQANTLILLFSPMTNLFKHKLNSTQVFPRYIRLTMDSPNIFE